MEKHDITVRMTRRFRFAMLFAIQGILTANCGKVGSDAQDTSAHVGGGSSAGGNSTTGGNCSNTDSAAIVDAGAQCQLSSSLAGSLGECGGAEEVWPDSWTTDCSVVGKKALGPDVASTLSVLVNCTQVGPCSSDSACSCWTYDANANSLSISRDLCEPLKTQGSVRIDLLQGGSATCWSATTIMHFGTPDAG
jgi:hypothetical protein